MDLSMYAGLQAASNTANAGFIESWMVFFFGRKKKIVDNWNGGFVTIKEYKGKNYLVDFDKEENQP